MEKSLRAIRAGSDKRFGHRSEAMTNERKWIRIGITVEDDATRAVALDSETWEILTAHEVHSRNGAGAPIRWSHYAEDIRRVLHALLSKGRFPPERVLGLSFGTTLGVNAALHARPPCVGLIDLDPSASLPSASCAHSERVESEAIPLLSGHVVRLVRLELHPLDVEKTEEWLDPLYALRARGAEGFVLNPSRARSRSHVEWTILESSERLGIPFCSLSEFSLTSDPGFRLRAAVCVVTALTDVFRVGELVHHGARHVGLRAPLFIVRNDGGIAPWSRLRYHPTLGFFSGPVAGILGALHHLKSQDGILLHIGQNASYMVRIHRGRVLEGIPEVAHVRIPVPALDLLVLAIGKESTVSLHRGTIARIGPWSAFALGLLPARKAPWEALEGARLSVLHPVPGEGVLTLVASDGRCYALTLGDAASCLGLWEVEEAEELQARARKALEPLAAQLALPPEDVAELILERAMGALADAIHRVLRRQFQDPAPPLIGMSAAASLFLPMLSQRLGLRSLLLERGELMGAWGAAIAELRETLEGPLVEEKELERLRQEVEHRLLELGAERASLKTDIRWDSETHWVRIAATGRMSPYPERPLLRVMPDQRLALAARWMDVPEEQVELLAETEGFEIYRGRAWSRRFFKRRGASATKVCVCDKEGNALFSLEDATVMATTAEEAMVALSRLLEDERSSAPSIRRYLLSAIQCLDLSRAASREQALRWAERALCGLAPADPVFLIEGRA
jgi:N-methylhydantoinase A/oxoprolinase/acetone carboxylase beta subunit